MVGCHDWDDQENNREKSCSLRRRRLIQIAGIGSIAPGICNGIAGNATANTLEREQFDAIYMHGLNDIIYAPFDILGTGGKIGETSAGDIDCPHSIRGGSEITIYEIQHEGEEGTEKDLLVPEDVDFDTSVQYEIIEVHGGCRGVDDNAAVTVEIVENEPPTAAFTFSPQQPVIDESVTFDASDSTDPDGEIAEFEWDFDSDGDADTTGEQVTHTFEEGGDHTVTLTVTDDDGATDSAEDVVTVWIPVTIDIKPGGDTNPINTESRGEIPVAILQTDDFDPTSRVDVDTVRFGAPDAVDGGGGATPLRGGNVEDVDDDGDDDLVLHFATEETEFDGDESEGKLVGETDDGAPLFGTDEVEFVGG